MEAFRVRASSFKLAIVDSEVHIPDPISFSNIKSMTCFHKINGHNTLM